MTRLHRFTLVALVCAAYAATAAPEELPPSFASPDLPAADPTWVFGVYSPPAMCGGLCPDWLLFQAPLDEVVRWQTHRDECAWRPVQESEGARHKWFLRPQVRPRVPDGILNQNAWRIRARLVPAPAEARVRPSWVDVLEWKAIRPVHICRLPGFTVEDVTHRSPAGTGAVVVQAGRTRGMSWVVITEPDPAFGGGPLRGARHEGLEVADVAWIAAPQDWSGPLQVSWNAAGDEATVSLEGRARLRVSWRTRSTTLIAPDPQELEAMGEVAKLSLREPGWTAGGVPADEGTR
jgi:hypothetical protein